MTVDMRRGALRSRSRVRPEEHQRSDYDDVPDARRDPTSANSASTWHCRHRKSQAPAATTQAQVTWPTWRHWNWWRARVYDGNNAGLVRRWSPLAVSCEFLGERSTLRSAYGMSRPSVCLSVCLLRRTQSFSAMFLHRLIACGLGHFVLKFWQKFEEILSDQVKWKRVWKTGVCISTSISLYFENSTIYGHSYNGRPIKSRMWSIDRRYFRWPWTILSGLAKFFSFMKRRDLPVSDKHVLALLCGSTINSTTRSGATK